jgi:hypothetical protein
MVLAVPDQPLFSACNFAARHLFSLGLDVTPKRLKKRDYSGLERAICRVAKLKAVK